MRINSLIRGAPLIVAGIFATASLASCSHPVEYYDPVYSDRHRWDDRESLAYGRWETEQRYQHIEYERRPVDEQRAYWNWRHAHPE
jgi:hypothetical protein